MREMLRLIHGEEEEEITKEQKKAFQCFMEKWPKLQEKLIEALIEYYNEEQHFSYDPDDEEELAEWWSEIETKEALLQAVKFATFIIALLAYIDKKKKKIPTLIL